MKKAAEPRARRDELCSNCREGRPTPSLQRTPDAVLGYNWYAADITSRSLGRPVVGRTLSSKALGGIRTEGEQCSLKTSSTDCWQSS